MQLRKSIFRPDRRSRCRLLRLLIPMVAASCLNLAIATLATQGGETAAWLRCSTIEERSLTFANGPATRFSNTVNGRTHQQTALTTFQGFQYVTFVDAERRICVGRRELPAGAWDVIRFEDHKFASNDSHNVSVLGICRKDGTIHLAFDHHASQLNYRVSRIGAAHRPKSVEWNSDLFGPIRHTLGSVEPASRVTYPRFIPAPNGNLMLYYRAVTSGNGDGMIEEYDGNRHDWTAGLGKFIARDGGEYTAEGEVSSKRCPYMNSLSYAGQRLHATWVWRDLFERTHPVNQHDLCYAYSDDHGRTWFNSAGQIIGKTGTEFIHLDTPGLVVSEIPTHSQLTNTNTHYAYPDGRLHVVLSRRSEATAERSYHHHWRSKDGAWQEEALPWSGDRPKLVGCHDGSLVLVYTDEERLFIIRGRPAGRHSGWQWTPVALPRPLSIYGESLMDLERWENEEVLSLYVQQAPDRQIETQKLEPIDGCPAPLLVVDVRLPPQDDSPE